jgi:hypothetical protein
MFKACTLGKYIKITELSQAYCPAGKIFKKDFKLLKGFSPANRINSEPIKKGD